MNSRIDWGLAFWWVAGSMVCAAVWMVILFLVYMVLGAGV